VPVALVTDSTAYLPRELAQRNGVRVVPLQVLIAGKAYDEDAVAPAVVASALRDRTPVTTSRPSPAAFSAMYARLADDGFDSVVSVHLSAEMSGTVASARLAAEESPIPVEVLDSRSLAMGLGFAVLAAAGAISQGSGPADAARVAAARAANTNTFFYVDTLDHLRRGGRIGAASALVGSALAIKPLLRLDDGRIVPLENVRTSVRGIARLEEIAVSLAGDRSVDVAVQHLGAAEQAAGLARRLWTRVPALSTMVEAEVGAVVGAHVGPGLLAVVIAPGA
jgi:fatty acid kinase fatty acid binding subunit